MPPKTRDIRELATYVKKANSVLLKAHGLSLLDMVTKAEELAKLNVKDTFGKTGSRRRQSGRLLNSIFGGAEQASRTGSLPEGFIGTRGIPYGRVHEMGGVIRPVKAQNLWAKNYDVPAKFKRMTPTEFIRAKQADPSAFSIVTGQRSTVALAHAGGGRAGSAKSVVLFFLLKKVTIPARPYLMPAAVESQKVQKAAYTKRLKELLGKA